MRSLAGCLGFFHFGAITIMLLWTFITSFHVNIYIFSLGFITTNGIGSTLWETARPFFKVTYHFTIPPAMRKGFGFSTYSSTLNLFYCSHRVDGKWNFMVLICIALMSNSVEHLFMCLLAIFISSSGKCLLKSFDHLKIALFAFLWLSCNCSLCIFWIVEPYQICDLQRFPPTLGNVFFTFLLVFFNLQFLMLTKSCLSS